MSQSDNAEPARRVYFVFHSKSPEKKAKLYFLSSLHKKKTTHRAQYKANFGWLIATTREKKNTETTENYMTNFFFDYFVEILNNINES